MENLGAYLQKLREDKGLGYKQVFHDLRLREDQVHLIEDNRFLELGTFGMARAIIQKYARYLDADMNAVVGELREILPEHISREFKPKKPVREKKILLSPNFFWTLGIILLVLVLASIVWYASRQGWLQMPEIFRKAPADSTLVQIQETEPPRPDSLRDRMRQLSTAPERKPANEAAGGDTSERTLRDSTDYIGEIIGPSSVNVPLN